MILLFLILFFKLEFLNFAAISKLIQNNGATTLMYACSHEDSSPMVKLLLNHQVDLWVKLPSNGANALTTAIKFEQKASALMLIHRGYDLLSSYETVIVSHDLLLFCMLIPLLLLYRFSLSIDVSNVE